MWLRVGDKRSVEPIQQTLDVISALIEHVDALSSTSSRSRSPLFRQSSTASYRGDNISVSGRSSSVDDPYRGGATESEVTKMTSLLHKMLITRQYRRSEVFDTHTISPTALLLVVLDDIWDDCIVSALAGLPAAFVVTSRDMNILQRVSTPVKMVSLLFCY